jgi:hypothetical protein
MRNENSTVFTKILIGLSLFFVIIITFLYLTVIAERPDYKNMIKGVSDTVDTADTPYLPVKDSIQ